MSNSDAAETNSKKKLKGEKGAVTSSSSARYAFSATALRSLLLD
jgi:hypothetical protein